MRIAQVAQLGFRVPPTRFGGTERIVSYLTEGLVDQGHEVVLFASGDSQTRAELVACSPHPLDHTDWQKRTAYHILMYERVYKRADEFDIIHNHTHLFGASLARWCRVPTVNTLHGALQPENIWEKRMFEEYRELPLVSLSQSHRKPFPALNWQATIYNGLPEDLYAFQERPGSYLAFLGRFDPNKGLTDAIEIAKRAGVPLKIAGYTGFITQSYLDTLKALFEHPLIEHVGELGDAEKEAFLGNALALLFPIQWEEPFGIVMIEALACGTPVIAYNRGSVPEIVEDGVNGLVVDSIDEAVAAVQHVATISRRQCRASFEEHFTARRMVDDYLCLYQRLRTL